MNSDDRIIKLKQQIAKKKAGLQRVTKFAPITNCRIKLDGNECNLHVLNETELIFLLVKLNVYYNQASQLNLLTKFRISGFGVEDWINDVNSRLAIIKFKEETSNLKTMENKLTSLLSNDKQTELQIDEIEAMLNESQKGDII